jgi:hypothetical protein
MSSLGSIKADKIIRGYIPVLQIALIPQPLLPILPEGEQDSLNSCVPLPELGEGFRVRAIQYFYKTEMHPLSGY